MISVKGQYSRFKAMFHLQVIDLFKGVMILLKVFRLGYVDFVTKDLEKLSEYYSEIIGFSKTFESHESAYFSSSTDHHNIALHASHFTGIQRIGLQLHADISVQDAAKWLNNEGINTTVKTEARPGVPELAEFTDQDGYIIQLFSSMEVAASGFKRNSIAPNKVGHLSLRVKDAKRSVEFYKLLGFTNTDWIETFFGFMTCNSDHHVLNFCTSPEKAGEMHHLAFELRDYSHLADSLDFLGKHEIPILWGPSRHGAGHNIATYHHDPDGNVIELFTDADVYIRELNRFEPRPWHRDNPQVPKVWGTDECISQWGTDFEHALV